MGILSNLISAVSSDEFKRDMLVKLNNSNIINPTGETGQTQQRLIWDDTKREWVVNKEFKEQN